MLWWPKRFRGFTWFTWWMQTHHHVAANPQTKPVDLGYVSTGRLLPSSSPSSFVVITQPKSWYSFSFSQGGSKAESAVYILLLSFVSGVVYSHSVMAIPCYQKYWIFFVKSFNTHMILLVAASTFGLCWRLESQSVLWHCWLGGRKGIRSVKNWVVRCWRGYLSGARCRLAYGPADATATHCLLLQ